MPDKKILLVDDDPKISAISSHLEKLGFKMLNARDGKKALEIIKSERPNLVILDMEMPGIDGLQILTILRAEYKDIKVFVFTAHGIEYKKKAEKIGYDRYFNKDDYYINDLEDSIKEAFGMEKVVERKESALSGKTPKARLLFIEPSIQMYSFTSALFDNPEFCSGEYERKVIYCDIDTLTGIILTELMNYQPDIVLINDYAMSEEDILNMVDLIRGIKIQPSDIVIHGLFERGSVFETQLKMKNVKRCIQNVMAHQQLIEMNEKLINFVNNVCAEHGLVKK
jgi:two-component system response regulator (stage 0 sporulation protein F)